MIRRLAPLAAFALVACATAGSGDLTTAVYKDPSQPVERRVNDLVRRMTLEEKIAQITTIWQQKPQWEDENGDFDPARAAELYPDGIGHVARPQDRRTQGSPEQIPYRDERETVALVNAIQRYNMEDTRLGIPALFHEEGLHGYAARGATSFPQAIGLASTWDTDLVEQVFTVAGREIRARGVPLVLSPVVDVARDPRWGRIEETYGEDPYLVTEMGVAAVRGFQGDALPLAPDRVFATLKHMTGHGQPQSGVNVGPAPISERELREVFFPPFEQIVARTNIMSVMPSYNEIDGVPSHANAWLLNDVLRGEWGFEGGTVSDYSAIGQMVSIHSVEPDIVHAAARALKSGVDFDLPNGDDYAHLPEALEAGLITERDIDRAVARMLTLKFEAGLFENPYADADYAEEITDNAEAQALALQAARETIVLLKNDGTLPLDRDRLSRIAVIGPNAAAPLLGGYSNVPDHVVTMLDGIKAAVGDDVEIAYHQGVVITKPEPAGDWYSDPHELADRDENLAMIEDAVAVARGADAVILVIGGNSATSREGWATSHLGDRSDIELVGEQNELAQAMFALGKPVVTVLINGKPLGVDEVAEKTNALIEGWYLGQEGGTAMAEVLFGESNPGGKLPVTMARDVGQLPLFYNHKPSALRGYLYGTTEPLYPFGWGLSYTTFDIAAPTLSSASIAVDGEVTVSTTVTNTGDRAGDEVVQLYIRDEVSSVTRPVKELKGFERVSLQPGESRAVSFTIGREALQLWDKDMHRVVEPGDFEIMVGPNSVDLKSATLTVEG